MNKKKLFKYVIVVLVLYKTYKFYKNMTSYDIETSNSLELEDIYSGELRP